MRRLIALLLACVAVAVVVAGCGGGDDDNGGGSSGNADTKEQPAPKAEDDGGGNAGGPQVSMQDIKFNPGTLKIKPGQTVTWTNNDSVGHDVTADAFKSGDAGGIEPGDTFQHKFPKAGTYDYVCTVHPGMKGTVKVSK